MRRAGKSPVIDAPFNAGFQGLNSAAAKQSAQRRKTWLIAAVAGLVLLASVAYLATRLPSASKPDSKAAQEQAKQNASISDATKSNRSTKADAMQLQLAKMQAEIKHEREQRVGNKTYHPSFGTFPRGCKWRLVTTDGSKEAEYQFWNFQQKRWVDERPAECTPTGFSAETAPEGWDFHNGTPRTEVTCDQSHCMYNNLYYNNGRWYALVDGPQYVPVWRFSRNQEVGTLHVKDVRQFTNSVKWRMIPGDTILFDFVFFIHPTAIGHWWEMLGPLFSILKRTPTFKRPCDQFVLLHLQRQHVLEWVRAMIAVTLGVQISSELPPIYIQEPTDNGWSQISWVTAQMLEGFERDTWYIFERVAITKDLYTGGGRTFLSRKDAREFRSLVYEHYGLPPPSIRPAIPRLITFQRKRANRRILNEDELIKMLKNYGELQVVEYNSTSSLYEQLLQMSRTGVYVSVHTSNLANAPLLQPGSAVVELIHRNWHWNGLDTSFKDQTLTMGDIHHYAWRAQFINQTVYLNPRDYYKVAHWPASQCGTEECVEAHTRVDVVVDVAEVKAILDSRLPLVWEGTPVIKAQLPWPRALDIPEDNIIPD